jgi:Ser-tRNA(Ala) deacylase AlaX
MKQQHIYLTDPSIRECWTEVLAVRDAPDGVAIELRENLYHWSSGGEPGDRGTIIIKDKNEAIKRIEKFDNATWVVIAPTIIKLDRGTSVVARLDGEHRDRKRKLHTLIHATLAIATKRLPGLIIESAHLSGDAVDAHIAASWTAPILDTHLAEIDAALRSIVIQGRKVFVERSGSIEEARERFRAIFRASDYEPDPDGIRLIVIEGLDVTPCGGTHFSTTNVGPYAIERSGVATQQRLSMRLRLFNAWTYWYGDRSEAREGWSLDRSGLSAPTLRHETALAGCAAPAV